MYGAAVSHDSGLCVDRITDAPETTANLIAMISTRIILRIDA
ncbi:MAG: hypothetical protein R3C17_06290 [Planctomycetaceae bacterium]